MNKHDIIYGFAPTQEYKMTFIPPTAAEIRAQKWYRIKCEFFDYLHHLALWMAVGLFISFFK